MKKTILNTDHIKKQRGAEFAGPENGGPRKIKDWKIQDLRNAIWSVIFQVLHIQSLQLVVAFGARGPPAQYIIHCVQKKHPLTIISFISP